MALSTHRVCIPSKEKYLCPPKRFYCPGGCFPGFCLNAQCPSHARHEPMYNRPELEREAEIHRQCIEQAVIENQKSKREEFFTSERKIMGMREPTIEEKYKVPIYKKEIVGNESQFIVRCPPIGLKELQAADGKKSLRTPVRHLCMLQVPTYIPPMDDYNQLSQFLRSSTMAGFCKNDTVSEYRDTHNMAVWNNRKDIDRQIYKVKRDWLSVWGESNVLEKRWRKAWTEKFGAGAEAK